MGAMRRFMAYLGFNGEPEEADDEAKSRRAAVVSLHAQKQMEIIVIHPQAYEEASAAADYLKARRPLVVNLQDAQGDASRRIVDFLSGVTYALDGHLYRVGEEIFLFTPSNVLITAESGRDASDGLDLFTRHRGDTDQA
ncbi:MAG: cell division protein SepF [Armatimonadetes bacterium]|nr:cell division protein SepF [Armatimonadota bacterium]